MIDVSSAPSQLLPIPTLNFNRTLPGFLCEFFITRLLPYLFNTYGINRFTNYKFFIDVYLAEKICQGFKIRSGPYRPCKLEALVWSRSGTNQFSVTKSSKY